MLHLKTTSGRWAAFCEQIATFLRADVLDLCVDGQQVRGFRSPDSPAIWLRDHSDMLRAGKYFEADMQSVVTCFCEAQVKSGRIFDYVMVPGSQSEERENWEKWVRVPVEADVEYRLAKAAYLAWQATGDTEWMAELLPALDRALRYTMTHPWRWAGEHGLVKRAYTIDTWDFDYTAGREPWLNFQITDDTFWGVMHGDNSGLYEAANLLATLYEVADQSGAAQSWRDGADGLRERANDLLFNGRFYTHFYKLTDVSIDGVDEAEQLSLSNPMAINRGMASHEIAVAILDEYQRRRASTGAFAEWFSIDPPFPDGIFGDEKLVAGAYCNGGVMPLVGGELARAALEHGREAYGVQILNQYRQMIADKGATYLWYFHDGTPSSVENSTSPEALPTDGWGSSAMLYAFVEGLCGIEDRAHSYKKVRCSPRWIAADEDEAEVRIAYAASGAGFGYRYRHDPAARRITITLEADSSDVDLHLLLPPDTQPTKVQWGDEATDFSVSSIEKSRYADASGTVTGEAVVEVQYADA